MKKEKPFANLFVVEKNHVTAEVLAQVKVVVSAHLLRNILINILEYEVIFKLTASESMTLKSIVLSI